MDEGIEKRAEVEPSWTFSISEKAQPQSLRSSRNACSRPSSRLQAPWPSRPPHPPPNLNPQNRPHFIGALKHTKSPRPQFPYRPLHARELFRMAPQKPSQLLHQRIRRGIGMNANRPQSTPLGHRPPKLLRDPRHTPAHKGLACKPVGDQSNSFTPQHPQRSPVKPVPRRNPNCRVEPMCPQNLQPSAYPLPLHLFKDPRKLGFTMQRHQSPAPRRANMPESMQPDRRPRRLHRPHLLPEARVRLCNRQPRVPIVRNHRQNRPQPKLNQQRHKPLPPFPIHRRAQVVEAQQILRRPRNHAAAFDGALGSSFHVQYHRNRNVLTVHSDVANAIPATPNQCINTRFSTTSNPRFSIPQ